MERSFFYSAKLSKLINLRAVVDIDVAPDFSYVVLWYRGTSVTLYEDEARRLCASLAADACDEESGDLLLSGLAAVDAATSIVATARRAGTLAAVRP